MKSLIKIMPWCFLALFATEILVVFRPKKDKDGEFQVREFARLPVLLNGRIQPFDSVAVNSLLQLRSTASLPLEIVPSWKFWQHAKKLKPTEWLLEVMTRPEDADTRRVFLAHHPDLLSELKLQDKGVENSGLWYFSFKELQPVIGEIMLQARKAPPKAELQTPYQRQVLKLANALVLYQKLKYTLIPEGETGFANELLGLERDIAALRAEARAGKKQEEFDQPTLARVDHVLSHFESLGQLAHVLNIPPLDPNTARDNWQSLGGSLGDPAKYSEVHPAVMLYARMAGAYSQNKPADFNQAVTEYRQWLAPNFPQEIKKGRSEFFYNDSRAFVHATIIYIFAFLLTGIGLLTYVMAPQFSESLRRSAFYLILLAGVVHTFGLIFRMVLEGRPPVTNLYSSAIFIGWGAMILGLVLERIYRIGIGNAVASVIGFVTLLIAHNLALGGDTMEMLQAVLDTNFWLATHVVIITLGYASTFVAGFIAIGYIILGLLTPLLSQKLTPRSATVGVAGGPAAGIKAAQNLAAQTGQIDISKALAKMVYGIICFATLFSFTGTVLGGIWADQSWGRFWGWDPKENGALMIVLWNATILHIRWGGMVKERGLMNLAIVGNIITGFSWFGVNMLGIGLHSYGFMDAAFKWLMLFNLTQLFFIGLGLIPLRFWRSFRGGDGNPPPPASGKPTEAPSLPLGKTRPA
jgi:cytochrome c-type biogenesis protein CcsB